MSSTELINLYNMMSTAISPITSSVSALSKVIALEAFTEHKNLVLETPGLATSNYITIDNTQAIRIHEQAFASWSDAWKWICQI